MWSLFAIAVLAADGPTVALAPDSGCAPKAVLRRELRRAPLRFVDDGAALLVRLTPEGPNHRLTVRAADDVMVERLLPTTSCDEAGLAAALIIDRAVRDIVLQLPDAGLARRPTGAPAGSSLIAALKQPRADAGTPPGPLAADDAGSPVPGVPSGAGSLVTADRLVPERPLPPTRSPPRPARVEPRAAPFPRGEPGTGPDTPPLRAPDTTRPTALDAGPPALRPPETRTADAGPGDDTPRLASVDAGSIDDTPPIPLPVRPPETAARASALDAGPVPTPTRAPETARSASIDGGVTMARPDAGGPLLDAGAVASPRPVLAEGARPPLSLQRVASREPEPAELVTPQRRSFELTAGGGGMAPAPSTVGVLLVFDAALRVLPRWRFGLHGAFSFGGTQSVLDEANRVRGSLTARGVWVLPTAMACLDTAVGLCGGLRAGARLAIGSASGPFLFQTRLAWVPTVAVGPAARASLAVGPLLVALDVTGLVNLTTPSLSIAGLPQSGVETPRFELLLALSVGARTR